MFLRNFPCNLQTGQQHVVMNTCDRQDPKTISTRLIEIK